MKIHINKGGNIITSLQNLIEQLKEVVGEYDTIQDKGLDLYVNLGTADGVQHPSNDKYFFVQKDGMLMDNQEYLMLLSQRMCKQRMLETIEYASERYRDAEERLNRAEAAYETAIRAGAGEKELERLKSSVRSAVLFKDVVASPACKRADLIKKCIDANKVSWSFHFVMFKKDPYEIKETFARPMIDKDCTILDKPYYFYSNAFFDDDKPVESWYKITTVLDSKSKKQ